MLWPSLLRCVLALFLCYTLSGWLFGVFLAVALSLCSVNSWAAPPDSLRVLARQELPGEASELDVDVLPVAADSSVLLYTSMRRRHEGDPQKHLFSSLDHQLRIRWTTAVRLPAGAECVALAAAAGVRLALCTLPANERALLIVRLAATDGAARLLHYNLPATVRPLRLEATPGAAYVVAQAYRQQTVVRLPLRDSAAVEFLSTFSSITSTISDVLPTDGSLHVLVSERAAAGTAGSGRLLARAFPTNSDLPPAPVLLRGPELISLTAGRLGEIPESPEVPGRLLVGTYASHDPRYVQGLFATTLPLADGGEAAPIRYYDLPTLPHFYDRFGPRHRARAAARAADRRRRGLETVSRARLLLHRPLPTPDGGAVMVAEQYYPRYRTGDTWGGYRGFSYRPYGGYNLGSQPFAYGLPGLYGPYDPLNVWDQGQDGYVFTQALVCAFAPDGRLRWQQSVVFDGGGLVRYTLTEQLAVALAGRAPDGSTRVAVALPDGETLRHTVVSATQGGPMHLPRTPLRLGLAANEKLLDTDGATVLPWHHNQLLLCAFQRISQKGRSREVLVLSGLGWD